MSTDSNLPVLAAESPRFDHLLHVVPDVEQAAREYSAAGLPAHANEPFEGFQNGGWRPDERYVEILTIVDREVFPDSPFGRATASWMQYIDPLLAGEGGALNFAVQVTDTAATAERLRRAGHRVEVHTCEFQEGKVWFQEVMILDAPAWAPFFITYRIDPEVMNGLKESALGERGERDLIGIVIETPDPEKAAAWVESLTGVPLDASGTVVRLSGGEVRFVPGESDRITALELTGGTPPDTVINGLRMQGV
ncbi:VOC family protein [Streptomyces sp. NPDC001339]|uniref:VOC family protein n=1 Tax=Streptomyces sp. NPDC001339 TaxID=3364563 RepID=UPI0036B7F3B9